jgi:Putative Actinobacterial Holin-X, holin superfamily III
VSDGNLPETIKRTAADVRRLAKLQAELVKQRVQSQAKRKGMFAAMAAGGGFLALYALLFLLGAAAAGLAIVFPVWLALLIVGGGVLLLSALLAGVGGLGLRGSRKSPAGGATADEEVEPWLRAKTP